MYDSYYNLTLKTLAMLNWASRYCTEPKFLAKIDDDNIVNFDNILHFAEASLENYTRFIGGSYRTEAEATDKGKWVDPIYPVVYKKDIYPAFLGGAGYILTNNITRELVRACEELPYIHLEDAFVTGICGEQLKDVKKLNMPGMSMVEIDSCYLKQNQGFTLANNISKSQMIPVWNKWHSSSTC